MTEHSDDCYLGGAPIACKCGPTAAEIAEIRSPLSLAAQVLYQCRILEILRETPDSAPDLLRDPVALQAAYKARWG